MQWAIGAILNSFALVFMSMRGFLPDFITIVVANTLIIAATGCIAYGIEVFAGSPRRTWMFASLAVSMFVLFSYFTYYSPNVNVRIVIISTFLAILYGYCGYIIHRYIPRLMNAQNMLLTIVFGIQAIWLVFRIVPTVFIEGPIVDFMKASTVQGMTFMVFLGGNIFVVIGLIILNFQRVEFDLLNATEEVKTLRGIIPICSSCKKIRDDEGMWNRIETYIREHSEAEFSHGICPECMKKL
ncbi:MAG: hypothetical protein JRL30_12185 [Deltaproteobacteria bacterium]|nr:hypothetical protein [Deltaproteobacteria bacterium]